MKNCLLVGLFSCILMIAPKVSADPITTGCKGVTIFATAATTHIINKTIQGKLITSSLKEAATIGAAAVGMKLGENIGNEICESASEVWMESVRKTYEQYGGNRHPGEYSVGGTVLGVSQNCLSTGFCPVSTASPYFVQTSMTMTSVYSSFYYNYVQPHTTPKFDFPSDPI